MKSSDYHPHDAQLPVMIGCVTALTKTTKENGATVAIPGSHLWGPERRPLDEEAIPAELEPGDAFIFLGNLYHAGGANVTEYVAPFFISMLHFGDHLCVQKQLSRNGGNFPLQANTTSSREPVLGSSLRASEEDEAPGPKTSRVQSLRARGWIHVLSGSNEGVVRRRG